MECSQSLSHELAPQIFANCTLTEGLEWCAKWCRDNYEINVDIHVETDFNNLPEDTRIFLLEAVRELLFNIHKHANTDHADIHLSQLGDMLQISVMDEGDGGNFDASYASSHSGGFGLFSISERLAALDGTMTIRSRPGDGATATMLVPLPNDTPPTGK